MPKISKWFHMTSVSVLTIICDGAFRNYALNRHGFSVISSGYTRAKTNRILNERRVINGTRVFRCVLGMFNVQCSIIFETASDWLLYGVLARRKSEFLQFVRKQRIVRLKMIFANLSFENDQIVAYLHFYDAKHFRTATFVTLMGYPHQPCAALDPHPLPRELRINASQFRIDLAGGVGSLSRVFCTTPAE